jgi:hypothetical protein
MENTGIFVYLYSHACPFMRGSAAIGEWIESAIYLSQGYNFTYGVCSGRFRDSDNLDALAAPTLGLFMSTYLDKVRLEPITKKARGP